MTDLEQSLSAIAERNRRVEVQKAWEVSKTRRVFIAAMTYATAFCYMRFALDEAMEEALMHAVVPTGGYLLSTFSLPIVKNFWIEKVLR